MEFRVKGLVSLAVIVLLMGLVAVKVSYFQSERSCTYDTDLCIQIKVNSYLV
jgi:hypothetical protein